MSVLWNHNIRKAYPSSSLSIFYPSSHKYSVKKPLSVRHFLNLNKHKDDAHACFPGLLLTSRRASITNILRISILVRFFPIISSDQLSYLLPQIPSSYIWCNIKMSYKGSYLSLKIWTGYFKLPCESSYCAKDTCTNANLLQFALAIWK